MNERTNDGLVLTVPVLDFDGNFPVEAVPQGTVIRRTTTRGPQLWIATKSGFRRITITRTGRLRARYRYLEAQGVA